MSLLYDLSANAVRRLYDARIDTPPVLDAALYFPDAARFAEAWPALRDEAFRKMSHFFCPSASSPAGTEETPARASASA